MDAWTRRQYDTAQDKIDEAIAILDEIWRDETKTFENRPVLWQRSDAGQAEEVRLIVMDNLIQRLHDAVDRISGLQPGPCEPEPPPHRGSPAAGSLKP